MAKLLEDLRFFIGSFFLILALMLIYQGLAHPLVSEGWNLNLAAGAGFLVFSLAALGLAVRASRY